VASPYREAVGIETVRARTREGEARLEVAPRHVVLTVADRVKIAVTERFVTLENTEGKRAKRRSMRLDHALLVSARAHPMGDLALWYQEQPTLMARVFGVQPVDLLESAGLEAWRELDLLAGRLRDAIDDHAGGVVRATEFGAGADRVLLLDYGDRYLTYVRRLFRERPRLALEVRDNGVVSIPARRRLPDFVCTSRFGVTVIGDHIRFADPTGADLGSLRIPWISPEDRKELARRFGAMLHQEDGTSARSPDS
jgi:hypothetical protein